MMAILGMFENSASHAVDIAQGFHLNFFSFDGHCWPVS